MTNLLNYIFWKNVNHNKWLYWIAFQYFFIRSRHFRNEVRLIRGIAMVEFQDQCRVKMAEMKEQFREITKILKATIAFLATIREDKP